MNSSDSSNTSSNISKSFKKELKAHFSKNQKETSFNTSTSTRSAKKNVSWADSYHESAEKKNLRKTPCHNPPKKMKINNSTPISLSFDENDSSEDDENCLFRDANISGVPKLKQGLKRKRIVSFGLHSNWIVSENKSKIKPNKTTTTAWKETDLLKILRNSSKKNQNDQSNSSSQESRNSSEKSQNDLYDSSTDESQNSSENNLNDCSDSSSEEPRSSSEKKQNGSSDSSSEESSVFFDTTCVKTDESTHSSSNDSNASFDSDRILAAKILKNLSKIKTNEPRYSSSDTENSDNYDDFNFNEEETNAEDKYAEKYINDMTCGEYIIPANKNKILAKYPMFHFSSNYKYVDSDGEGSDTSTDIKYKFTLADKKKCEISSTLTTFYDENTEEVSETYLDNIFGLSQTNENTSQSNKQSKSKKTKIKKLKKKTLKKEVQVTNGNLSETEFVTKIRSNSEIETQPDAFPPFINESELEIEDLPESEEKEEEDTNTEALETYVEASETNEKENETLDLIRYHITPSHCMLVLKHPLKLYFNGKLGLSVLSGSVEILGHKLETTNEVEVYSPRGNCFLCIETTEPIGNKNLSSLLSNYGMNDEEVTNFCADLQETDCVIAVRQITNSMTKYLQKHVAQIMFPKDILSSAKRPLAKVENKLQCIFELKPTSWKIYSKNDEWESVIKNVVSQTKENNSRTVLCGGKGVGKSMLLRYMINRLLKHSEKVVIIDLDPGQSEFTIPGCVSVTLIDAPIFGPNYTHLRKPDKSFFLGDVNIVQCLDRYIKYVKNLIDYCKLNIDVSIPWIINYMGFTRSIGTDLIIAILKLVSPTLVVQVQSDTFNRNYNVLLKPDFVTKYDDSLALDVPQTNLNYKFKVIKSMVDTRQKMGEWEAEPRQIREMCILSYFSLLYKNVDEITAVAPYAVNLSSIKLHHVNYSNENLSAALNANLVALCTVDVGEEINNQSTFSCIGFGVIRGADLHKNELYLLTPVTEEELEDVNCLVMGCVTLPPSVYMTCGLHKGLIPYVSLGIPQGTSLIPKRSLRSRFLIRKK